MTIILPMQGKSPLFLFSLRPAGAGRVEFGKRDEERRKNAVNGSTGAWASSFGSG
jgi:hypothetical protein